MTSGATARDHDVAAVRGTGAAHQALAAFNGVPPVLTRELPVLTGVPPASTRRPSHPRPPGLRPTGVRVPASWVWSAADL